MRLEKNGGVKIAEGEETSMRKEKQALQKREKMNKIVRK